MGDTALIEFRNVAVTLGGQPIFGGLDFAVREGEFLCILGPSGCGKSTTLRVIGDLLGIDGGRVAIAGEAPSARWREIAFVFQSPRLVPWRNALDNIVLGMELRFDDRPRAAMLARARELLELVGLGGDGHKFPSMLSGGERQRVALARALAVDPRIVLMDEPFSALDPNTRQRLRDEVVAIWRRTGKTIVFVTHDIDEAVTLADRVILLSNKPTRVIDTLVIDAPRPRRVHQDPVLIGHRQRLRALFAELEPDEERDMTREAQ